MLVLGASVMLDSIRGQLIINLYIQNIEIPYVSLVFFWMFAEDKAGHILSHLE